MSNSASISCELREQVGSRPARKLRAQGRTIASLQPDDGKPHLNLHFDQAEFLTARRNHVHLYDLQVGSEVETAVVRELQWDAMGDVILNVEFKRVTRGVATESEVELRIYGQVASGVVTLRMQHITISCIPSMIPDDIEVDVNGLETGEHIKAGSLTLPEGVELALDPDVEVAVVSGVTVQEEEAQPVDGEVEDPEGGETPAPEGGEG